MLNVSWFGSWNDFLLFIVGLLLFSTTEGAMKTNESRLHEVLLHGYNKYAHPSFNTTAPVHVEFDFQLIRIIGVSAKDQFIKTYAWVNQYWYNYQLVWDPKDYGGIEVIYLQPQDVWVPDVLLYNNVDEEDRFGGGVFTYKTNVALRYDGYQQWLNPAIFKSICDVDVTFFPFDDQNCKLKFGSWAFDISKINLHSRKVTTNANYVKNGEFKLMALNVRRNEVKYQCCQHAFVDVTVIIKIRRESLDYILKLIIPCSLISSMIFLGFILPPESGERIGLSITVLLAMTVFQQLSSELMPSYGFPLLGQYYFATIVEIGLSLFVTTLILNFYHRNSRRMPKTLRKLILHWLAPVVFPFQKRKDWDPAVKGLGELRQLGNEEEDDSSDEEEEEEVVDRICEEVHIGDDEANPWVPLSLQRSETMDTQVSADGVSPTCTYPLERNGNHQTSHFSTGTNHQKRCRYMKSANDARYSLRRSARSKKGGKMPRRSRRKCAEAEKKLPKTSIAISHILPFVQENAFEFTSDEKKKNQKEWLKAARVLDRLFLILSVLIGVFTLIGIFLKAPRFHPT